jgi:multidrug resistance efflux pump
MTDSPLRVSVKALWGIPLIAFAILFHFRVPASGQHSTRLADRSSNNAVADRESKSVAILTSDDGWIRFDQGIVVAPDVLEVAVQETGTILDLKVSENSMVTKGDLLGRLNSETIELEKQVAALQFQVAQAEALDDSDIRFAEMVVDETRIQYDAYEQMGNKGEASPLEVRQKKIAAEQAKVRLIQAKAARVQKELKAKLAQASYSVSQNKLDKLQIVSPVTGIVTRVDHRQGEWVSAGAAALHIVRMDELRVDFFIDLDQFEPSDLIGAKVEITPSMAATRSHTRFVGMISGYAPEVSSTRKVRMSATVQNLKTEKAWSLLPGMNVSLQTHLPKK